MIKCRNQTEQMALAALLVSLTAIFYLMLRVSFLDTALTITAFVCCSFIFYQKTGLKKLGLYLVPALLIAPLFLLPQLLIPLSTAALFTFFSIFIYQQKGLPLFFFTIFIGALAVEGADLIVNFYLFDLDGIKDLANSIENGLDSLARSAPELAGFLSLLKNLVLTFAITFAVLYPLLVALLTLFIIVALHRVYHLKTEHHNKIRFGLLGLSLLYLFTLASTLTFMLSFSRATLVLKVMGSIATSLYLLLSILLAMLPPAFYLMKKAKIGLAFAAVFASSLILFPLSSIFALGYSWRRRLKAAIPSPPGTSLD